MRGHDWDPKAAKLRRDAAKLHKHQHMESDGTVKLRCVHFGSPIGIGDPIRPVKGGEYRTVADVDVAKGLIRFVGDEEFQDVTKFCRPVGMP